MRHARLIAAFVAAALAATAHAQEQLAIPDDGYAVSDNLDFLPEPVRAKREALLTAAKSGDIAKLRAIFDAEPAPPTVSFGDPADPIAHLEQQSGDGGGIETLAILAKLLQAPYAAMAGGDGQPIYVWPYLAAYDDLNRLKPSELVDGYRIMGYGRFTDMQALGAWYYWRVYIGPQGELQAFVAGD